MSNLKISNLIAIHTIISAVIGIVLAFFLFINFQKVEVAHQNMTAYHVISKDILRIEEGFKQYLILMDLVLGNHQTYLASGSQRQAELLLDISNNISKNDLPNTVIDNIAHFILIIEQSSDVLSLIQEGSLAPPTQLDLFDKQMLQAVNYLSEINSDITQRADDLNRGLEQQKHQSKLHSIFALVGFILFIVFQWLWITLYIVRPIQKLNSAVISAQQNTHTFNFDYDMGPAEIKELANNAALFINDLEQAIKLRTDLYRAERDKALVATNAKTKFLSTLSHELKSPLHVILGFSQILKNETLHDEHLGSVEMISEAGEKLNALISSIFKFIKIEDDQLNLSISSINVRSMIDQALENVHADITNKELNVNLNVETNNEEVFINADPQHLLIIYSNIVMNAIKYSSMGNVIDISLYIIDEQAVLSITDYGEGIKPEYINDIFTPFIHSQEGYAEGLGISLYMAKKVVEMMGGKINVESTFGKGSTFKVSFPIEISSLHQ